MKSLIFGATGMVGEFIADHLIRRGAGLTVCPDVVTQISGQRVRQPPTPCPRYPSYPLGFWLCHRQWSLHMASRFLLARHPPRYFSARSVAA
jgi:hypothetical protein